MQPRMMDVQNSPFTASDPQRAVRYAEALEYWPGKFCDHATIGDRLRADGHQSIIDCGGTGSFVPFLDPSVVLALANPDINGLDGCSLPFADDSFDAGISTHTLEHIASEKRESFLTEIVRVSRSDIYLICPLGVANVEIDAAKTSFVGNTHRHDEFIRVTLPWLQEVLEKHAWEYEVEGLLERSVHFLLAMLLPINDERKRAICRWINVHFDVNASLGDPYNVLLHIKKS